MIRIIGLAGSLRQGSYNAALLRAAVGLAPDGAELVPATIHGVPLYDADVEAEQGIPPAVAALKDQVAAADGLILFTPEYNNSVPGVFKNAIDWMSRPPADAARVFAAKPVALVGATSGNFGTTLSQAAWLPVLRALGTNPWFGRRLLVPRARSVFDAAGTLASDEVREQLRSFLAGFAGFVRDARRTAPR